MLFIPQVWKQQAIKHSISFLEQLEIQVAPVTSAPAPLQAQAAQVTQALAPIASAPVPDTPAAVTPATNPPDRPVASAGLFAGVIPLVYVWFCGEVMLVEQGKVAWNITRLGGSNILQSLAVDSLRTRSLELSKLDSPESLENKPCR